MAFFTIIILIVHITTSFLYAMEGREEANNNQDIPLLLANDTPFTIPLAVAREFGTLKALLEDTIQHDEIPLDISVTTMTMLQKLTESIIQPHQTIDNDSVIIALLQNYIGSSVEPKEFIELLQASYYLNTPLIAKACSRAIGRYLSHEFTIKSAISPAALELCSKVEAFPPEWHEDISAAMGTKENLEILYKHPDRRKAYPHEAYPNFDIPVNHYKSPQIVQSNDGRYAVASINSCINRNATITVIDKIAKKTILTIPHQQPIGSIQFSPDGQMIATSSNLAPTRIWNLQGDLLKSIKRCDHTSITTFSPRQHWFAVSSTQKKIYMWNMYTNRLKQFPCTEYVQDLVFNPNEQQLAVITQKSAEDKSTTLHLSYYFKKKWGIKKSLNMQRAHLYSYFFDFSPDGKLFIYVDSQWTAHVHHSASGDHAYRLDTSANPIRSVQFSPDNQRIITIPYHLSNNPTIHHAINGKCLQSLPCSNINRSTFSSNGKYLLTLSPSLAAAIHEYVCLIVNLETGNYAIKILPKNIAHLMPSPDGQEITGLYIYSSNKEGSQKKKSMVYTWRVPPSKLRALAKSCTPAQALLIHLASKQAHNNKNLFSENYPELFTHAAATLPFTLKQVLGLVKDDDTQQQTESKSETTGEGSSTGIIIPRSFNPLQGLRRFFKEK